MSAVNLLKACVPGGDRSIVLWLGDEAYSHAVHQGMPGAVGFAISDDRGRADVLKKLVRKLAMLLKYNQFSLI